MMQAIWNDTVLAKSEQTIVVEGNHYFPPESINQEYFKPSDTHSFCGWKGQANYYTLSVSGAENKDAAWYYPNAKEKAKNIEGYIAFWRGVKISEH